VEAESKELAILSLDAAPPPASLPVAGWLTAIAGGLVASGALSTLGWVLLPRTGIGGELVSIGSAGVGAVLGVALGLVLARAWPRPSPRPVGRVRCTSMTVRLDWARGSETHRLRGARSFPGLFQGEGGRVVRGRYIAFAEGPRTLFLVPSLRSGRRAPPLPPADRVVWLENLTALADLERAIAGASLVELRDPYESTRKSPG
jgi:hypothetical protein